VRPPKKCVSKQEIRDAIDSIDTEIMLLFGKRFEYVKEIVKFKTDEKSIIAAKRREEVIQERRRLATENGLDPDIFEKIYRILIEHFISEEMNILNKTK